MYTPKFEIGTVFKMLTPIAGIFRSRPDWPRGYYRVDSVSPAPFSKEFLSYKFSKIRKDGTVFKSFSNGYDCGAWDKFVDSGKILVVDNKQFTKKTFHGIMNYENNSSI